MRLFVATPVVIPNFKEIKSCLQGDIEGKWVEEHNLHLTHFFIGNDDPQKYKITLPLPKDEMITLKSISLFDEKILYINAYSKHIYYINDFFSKTFHKKSRFKPHITLCRIKRVESNNLSRKITEIGEIDVKIEFKVFLCSSTLTRTGPIYKKIYDYSLDNSSKIS